MAVKRHRRGLRQVDAENPWLAGLSRKPRAQAVGAWPLAEEPRHAFEALLVLRLGERVLHGVYGVVVGEIKLGEIVALLWLVQDMLLDGRAVEHDIPFGVGQLVEWNVRAHAHRAAHLLHQIPHQRTPGQHGSVIDAFRLVGYQRLPVDRAHDARSRTGWACAGGIERQLLGGWRMHESAAGHASNGQLGGDVHRGSVACAAMLADMRGATREQQTQTVEQLRHRAERGAHAGHRRPLMQGERRGHMPYGVHLSAACLGETTSGIRRQSLQIAS